MITQLVQNDVENSNVVRAMESGTFPALEAEAAQNDIAINTPPIARSGHFTFALLDLIQQAMVPTTGSAQRVDESMKLGLYVAKTSAHSFLRRKALEVLFYVGQVEGVRLVSIERELAQITEHRKLADDWRDVKRQGERRDSFRSQLASIVIDSKSTQQVTPLQKLLTRSSMDPFKGQHRKSPPWSMNSKRYWWSKTCHQKSETCFKYCPADIVRRE